MNDKQIGQRHSFGARVALVLATLCVLGVVAHGGVLQQLSRPFQAGNPIVAADVNHNFEVIAQELDDLRADVDDLRQFRLEVERSECPADYLRTIDFNHDPGCANAVEEGDIVNVEDCTREHAQWVICAREVPTAVGPVVDEVVKVVGFWIDRYEMYVPGDRNDPRGIGVSREGFSPPTGAITWFEATTLCTNAGKRLCTNAEWQVAATGTPDHGESDGAGGRCLTRGVGGPRLIGDAQDGDPRDDCVSRFGAEDMIGNVSEWVADWYVSGEWGWRGVEEEPNAVDWMYDWSTSPWPDDYNEDRTRNVYGQAYNGETVTDGMPAAAIRGGDFTDRAGAGLYSFGANLGPSTSTAVVGGRCCIGGR